MKLICLSPIKTDGVSIAKEIEDLAVTGTYFTQTFFSYKIYIIVWHVAVKCKES
jgi:hypothetical protein